MDKLVTALVVAPHPDDETLGCGGTLLKHKARGDTIHWLMVTGMSEATSYTKETISRRQEQIKKVSQLYGFDSVHSLDFPTTQLDIIPLSKLLTPIGEVFHKVGPSTIYLPNRSDAHSDHRITFAAAYSCTKWFRYPSIRRVLMYETLSETEFSLPLGEQAFVPNSFSDISDFLERKIDILKVYDTELGKHPFPRSPESVRALATLRGAAAGVQAAESFVLLKEILSDE